MKNYILRDHEKDILPLKDIFVPSLEEITKPVPSISIPEWPIFDSFTGGLREREFSIICGPTGKGKTQILSTMCSSFLIQNESFLVGSVETGHLDFSRRMISSLTGEDWNSGEKISNVKVGEFWSVYNDRVKNNKAYFLTHDNRVKIETLLSEIAYAVKNYGTKVAILDNLNFFMEVTRASDSNIEMDRVVHDSIIFCKQNPVHLFMVMHPKKTIGGRIESEFDIKGSSTAVQEAQNVFLFNVPSPEAIEHGAKPWYRELTIAKMRRRGKHVGKKIYFDAIDGVKYVEVGSYEPWENKYHFRNATRN